MTCILGLETSCDETAASVVDDGRIVRSNVIASQHDLHARYQGVVPEIASRAHLERMRPVIDEALAQAGASLADVDIVAVGNRPGLIGSLLVGVSAAKALAWSLGKPLIGVNHVHAHLYAAALHIAGSRSDPAKADIAYPALGLVVSGGHSNLYLVTSPTQLQLIGRTIDDAVGEAYDKAAVILGLPFPGGPNLDRLAQTGNPDVVKLPRAMLDDASLDFSFSGLKTALLYAVRGRPTGRGREARFERSADDLSPQQRADLAASFQAAAIEALIAKLERALDEPAEHARCLIVGGGVSANSLLRERVTLLGQSRNITVHLPAMNLCLDNAAMIAGLAHQQWQAGAIDDLHLPAVATLST